MRESTQQLPTEPSRGAIVEGLSRARSISFALVNMDGRLVAHNDEFAKAVLAVKTDDLSQAGTPLGDKLADASTTAAWQGISVRSSWEDEGGWSDYEVLPTGDEGALILGHRSAARSCLVADQERQMLRRTFFDDNPLPMLLVEPRSKVIIDVNNAACDMLRQRRDILTSMVLDQTGIAIKKELSAVRRGAGRRAGVQYRPRLPGAKARRLRLMMNLVEMGGLEQVHITVLDIGDAIE